MAKYEDEEVHVEDINRLGGIVYDPRTLRSTSIVDNIYATRKTNRQIRANEQSIDSFMRKEINRIGRARNERGLAHSLWSRVHQPDEGCWEWQGSKNPYGYGVIVFQNDALLTHRVALELTLGRPLGDGMVACHKCDRPPCCRPDHLFEGTHQDNMDDMWAKGRSAHQKRWSKEWVPPRTPREKPAAYGDPALRAIPISGVCWICGGLGADTRDHVLPVSLGGTNDPENIRSAHRACNSARGNGNSWATDDFVAREAKTGT